MPSPHVVTLNAETGPEPGGTSVTSPGSDLTYADEVLFRTVPVTFAAFSDKLILATARPVTER